MRSRLRFPVLLLLTLGARIASADEEAGDFREDVFACEEAVAHLASCCPSLAPNEVRCLYRRDRTDGCDYAHYYEEDPGIGADEAECLLALDCGTIRERGICERAHEIKSRTSERTTEMGSTRGESSSPRSELLCK